jgi:Putative transmembrane protein (Alph_Pro_TM).
MKRDIIVSILLMPLLILLCFPSAVAWGKAGSRATMTITPQKVSISTLYNGKTISVQADLPKGTEVALTCEGPENTLILMRKGKICGLWMNVEEIVFHKVPTLYFLQTSKKIEKSNGHDTMLEIGLGYESLCSRAQLEKKGEEEKANLFNQLVKLKESENLYSVSEGTIKITHAEDNNAQMTTTFHLPSKAQPGKYKINLFQLNNSEAILLNSQPVTVEKAGFTTYLSSLAINHGLLYGVIAVIIAIISGLAVGILFGSRGGH